MEGILIYIVFIAVMIRLIVRQRKNSQGEKKPENTAASHRIDRGRVTPAAVGKQSSTRVNSSRSETVRRVPEAGRNIASRARGAATEWARSVYEADRDSHYDRESLDYCDSDVPSGEGISFRELPAGTDELAYLRTWNRKREKLLEKSLESRS